jgi:hypothetical protein
MYELPIRNDVCHEKYHKDSIDELNELADEEDTNEGPDACNYYYTFISNPNGYWYAQLNIIRRKVILSLV